HIAFPELVGQSLCGSTLLSSDSWCSSRRCALMGCDKSVVLAGRLGSPNMVLRDDPRADPRLISAMTPLGLGGAVPSPEVDPASPVDVLLAYIGANEQGFEMLGSALAGDLPTVAGVACTVEVVEGVDGNEITLFVHHPNVDGPLPAIVHLHGGNMVMIEAA